MILIVILYALLALTFPIAQYATFYAEPTFLVGIRMCLAGFLLILINHYRGQTPILENLTVHDCWLFAKTILFHVILAFLPEFWALQYLTPLKVNCMFSATPFITAFFEIIILKRSFNILQIIGMLIGTGGILFLTFATANIPCSIRACTYPLLPEAMLMLAVISAAYAWFVINNLRNRGYSLLFINGISMAWGGILSLGIAGLFLPGKVLANTILSYQFVLLIVVSGILRGLFIHYLARIYPLKAVLLLNRIVQYSTLSLLLAVPALTHSSLFVFNWPGFILTTLLLIGISNIAVYNLYGALLTYYRPTLLSLAGLLSPLFGALYAFLFFGQLITWHYLITFILIGLGLYLFTSKELTKKGCPLP